MKSQTVNNKFIPWVALLLVSAWIYVIYISLNIQIKYDFKEVKTELNLGNIIEDERELTAGNGNQIFFIESNLKSKRSLENPRQACRLEAKFKTSLSIKK